MTETEVGNSKDLTSHVIYVLPPNVHSLNNKLTESDVACCREHCQQEEQMKLPSTELFKLLFVFSRIGSEHRKKNLLLMYNLVNTVVPPTRITKNHYRMQS